MKSKILVFLFVLILTVNFSFAATTDSSQASCEDSDYGIDYTVKGALNYHSNIYSDTCENNYVIKEYYCSKSAPISESQKSNPQKNNFFTNLFGFFSISGRAVQQTQKNTSVPSALILLAIIVIALIYLRKIYDEPQPRNQSKRLLNNRKK